jgi:hypothetical protein
MRRGGPCQVIGREMRQRVEKHTLNDDSGSPRPQAVIRSGDPSSGPKNGQKIGQRSQASDAAISEHKGGPKKREKQRGRAESSKKGGSGEGRDQCAKSSRYDGRGA